MYAAPISNFPDAQPLKIKISTGEIARRLLSKAGLCQGLQQNTSAGFHERSQMNGNLGRRELIKPVFVASSLELPFFDRNVQNKARDTVKQCGNDAHLGCHGRTPKRSDRRLAKDGIILLERAVGSFGCRAQGMQLPIPLRTSGDLQDKTRMLSNRNMRGITKPIRTMRTFAVKIKIGRRIGFHALLETGERKALGSGIKAIRSSGKMTVRNIRPAVAIVTSFKKSFTDQLFIPGIVID